MAIKIFKVLLLAAWACFFAWLVGFGRDHLARLLHPDLWWMVICATVILLIFLVVNYRKPATKEEKTLFLWQWPSLTILLVPLLFFVQFQDARFNGGTFAKRSIATEEGFLQGEAGVGESPEQYNELDIPVTQLNFNSEKYIGTEVRVVCQTHVDDRLPKGIVMCYRYLMTCCAADARPVFVFIEHPEDRPIEKDKWISAKGILSMTKNSGIEVPTVSAASVEYVKEPKVPFVFF